MYCKASDGTQKLSASNRFTQKFHRIDATLISFPLLFECFVIHNLRNLNYLLQFFNKRV